MAIILSIGGVPPFYYNDGPVGWPRPKYSVKVLVTKSLKTYFVKLHGVENCIPYAHHYTYSSN